MGALWPIGLLFAVGAADVVAIVSVAAIGPVRPLWGRLVYWAAGRLTGTTLEYRSPGD